MVMSKTPPILFCSSSAFVMRSSVPAKCSQVGMIGKGFSPSKRTSFGCLGMFGFRYWILARSGRGCGGGVTSSMPDWRENGETTVGLVLEAEELPARTPGEGPRWLRLQGGGS